MITVGFPLLPFQEDTGAGYYYCSLIRHLLQMPHVRCILFVPKPAPKRAYDLFGKENCIAVPVCDSPSWKRMVQTVTMSNLARFSPVPLDIMHSFNYPLFAFKGPHVLTIYDLRKQDFPDRPGRVVLEGLVKRRTLGRADKIITISDYTRQRLVGRYPECAPKCETIYLGFEPGPMPPNLEEPPYSFPYLLSVGWVLPHKNHARLVDAFIEAMHKSDTGHHLIIIGRNGHKDARLEQLLEHPTLGARIHFTGRLSEAEVYRHYRHAALFVYPSLYEGFGMPLLEANHFGIPVLASDATVFPELVDNPAALFDPYDIAAMSQKITAVLHDSKLRESLIAHARNRFDSFTNQRMAQQTASLYEQLLSSTL